jgi:hypothetical protein
MGERPMMSALKIFFHNKYTRCCVAKICEHNFELWALLIFFAVVI